MVKVSENAMRVLKKRYFRNGETKWEQLVDRVVDYVTERYNKDVVRSVKYDPAIIKDLMYNMKFLPNSPTLMNAGYGTGQLSACFTLPVDDSIESIFEQVKNAAVIFKSGGGVGMNLGKIRPKGARVGSSNGIASGPVSFMEAFDTMAEVVKQGGTRRGAFMTILPVTHPDIEEFIKCKQNLTKLTNMNISVLITTGFMGAVESDGAYTMSDGTKKKARPVMELIAKCAAKTGEPGVIFGDNVPETDYTEVDEIITNPCVVGRHELLTNHGYFSIKDLVGETVEIWNGFEWSEVEPFHTGRNQIWEVEFSNGSKIECTGYHNWPTWVGYARDGHVEKLMTKELQPGMKLQKCEVPVIEFGGKQYNGMDMYTQGFYAGDGNADSTYSCLYAPKYCCKDRLKGSFKLKPYKDRDGIGWNHGHMLAKDFVPKFGSVKQRVNFLAGLIDADGHVQSNKSKHHHSCHVIISSVDKKFLENVRLMLTTLGVQANILNMKPACKKLMPDGKGGMKKYNCQESYRLCIGAMDLKNLVDLGLRLERVDISGNNPRRGSLQFVKVVSVERTNRYEETFCVTEPKNHTMYVSGIISKNCGEQVLPPYGSCNLGSMDVSKYVLVDGPIIGVNYKKLQGDSRQAAMFLDAIRIVNKYPLEEIKESSIKNPRIGLGMMGLADALIKVKIPYASEDGRMVAAYAMKAITKGAADGARCCMSVTTIAPTGTVSMIASCSSGCEPRFSNSYYKNVLDGESFLTEYEDYKNATEEELESGVFATAMEISPEDHIRMQAALQKNTTNSISKTVNLPSTATEKDVMAAYLLTYKLGCKGITVYVDGCRDNQVLTTGREDDKVKEVVFGDVSGITLYEEDEEEDLLDDLFPKDLVTEELDDLPVPYKLELPDQLYATRYRISDPDNKKIYFTVCDMDGKPVEVFTKLPTELDDSHYHTISRLLSLAMRYNIPLEDITNQLRKSSSSISDLPNHIARILEGYSNRNLEEELFIDEEIEKASSKEDDICNPEQFCSVAAWVCPDCGASNQETGGCHTCSTCGYSSCS